MILKLQQSLLYKNKSVNNQMEKYKKVKIVGKGSFGYAVLVESRKNRKQYIMKIIDISKMDEKQIEQALMEVHLLKVMRYPYVVTYRQSFMEKMCLCIVMDYCQGGDMFHKIAKQKQIGQLFPQYQIVTWFVQMALAMNYVHDKKILHRDLKTQNIFLTSKGDIKIGDFGIARVLQHTYDCANTAIGTPYYLSPQICQQKPYNQKSDIWSLGCILYEIATLNHAFDAQNMKGLVQKILKGTYPPLPEQYSPDLKKLISEMLIKDPNKRPSIKKILQMPFMKAKVNELFSSTLKTHEFQLQKEGTHKIEVLKYESSKLQSNKTQNSKTESSKIQNRQFHRQQLLKQKQRQNERQKSKEEKKINMFKRKQEPQKKENRKIELISKNQSEQGFKQRSEHSDSQNSCSRNKQLKIRTPLNQESQTNRSFNKEVVREKNIQKGHEKKSVMEEQETLEEQGYGELLRDMKKCIKGETNGEAQAWRVQDKVVPKYLQMQHIPGFNQKDTVASKIEALRVYLQRSIGDDFVQAYNLIHQQQDEDYQQVKKFLGPTRIKFIPLIVQLIVCEDSYY